ncbi:MAG: hydrolase [Betaproteobacteria bacterium RIFCSPLOWO2_12_FULL_62_58]|nr:MAG: hydrolase [Betaproteobacteria bacterium RIFCSPLOWO2_12_FULL_62_58]
MSRRRTLTLLGGLLVAPKAFAQAAAHRLPLTSFAPVVPGYRLRFPHDEGSHPDFRLEWWYITGWLNDAAARPLGFQITFFRARPELKHDNPSAFTPRQIMIAHAAISDPLHGRLIHAQRAARAGFELAGADEGRTRVWIDHWSLEQRDGTYRAQLPAQEFQLDFTFAPTQPPLLQGEYGLSRKGPAPESASYYYSLPHLEVTGTLARRGKPQTVTGSAWLDHEWSSSYLAKEAVGWDWIGVNLDDGGALMAFRMRDKNGGSFWAGGALRRADGSSRIFSFSEVQFTPRREWRSARTGTSYPVSWLVRAGDREVVIEPLFDDQEHDTRNSTGAIYWEGAAHALVDGKPAGRGYLELTGYWRPLRF